MGHYHQVVYCHNTSAGHFHYPGGPPLTQSVQQTIGIHVRGSGHGAANERFNPMLAETRLQWSSDSTIGVSPSMAVENGRRRQHQQQQYQRAVQQHLHHLQQHHHQQHQHHYQIAPKKEATMSTSTTSASTKTNGVQPTADDDGCSGCVAVDIDEDDQQMEVDVCACCSEWLSKALLCSCQIPSSSESSSPSQCNNGETRRRNGQSGNSNNNTAVAASNNTNGRNNNQ